MEEKVGKGRWSGEETRGNVVQRAILSISGKNKRGPKGEKGGWG